MLLFLVCSTTLWVGHLSKLVYQEELSDTFGEFGDIVSIDQIVPRGCAFIVMNRRQDAYKAMQNLKNHKLQGRAITISWAAGKGVKSKEWKDYWDLELGVTYIPWNKLDESTDFDSLEEGGMFDEDSMPNWMKEKIRHLKSLKDKATESAEQPSIAPASGMLFGIDTTQPPPVPPGPPSLLPMTMPGQFSMAPPMSGPPRPLMSAMGMQLTGLPMPPNLMTGMPPPHPMMVPPGMMPPGFPPMTAGGPPPLNTPHLNLPPPSAPQFVPPPGAGAIPPPTATSTPAAANASNDDHMDMEMDDEDNNNSTVNTAVLPPAMNFNQPPPLFGNNLNATAGSGTETNGGDIFSRDRNRSSSRWSSGGSRSGGADSEGEVLPDRWRENGPCNFNENRNSARPLNIPPLDLNNPPQRPDFINDFENRSGGRGGGGGGPPRPPDFFPNMQQMPQNRFNQPTSLLQMRIPPPPNMFNQRMPGNGGGGPMFMRGGPPPGPGGFFNSRNPFNTDGAGRGNARGRGGGRGGRNNLHGNASANWSDEEGEDVGFKRRGGGGGNRFRDNRDAPEERNNRGPRRGSNDWPRGNRGDRRDFSSNRHNARGNGDDWKPMEEMSPVPSEVKPQRDVHDTEEDWDRELDDYDARVNVLANKKPDMLNETSSSSSSNHNNKTEHNETAETCENANGREHNESQSNGNDNSGKRTPLYEDLPEISKSIDIAPEVSETVDNMSSKQQENTPINENAVNTLTTEQPENSSLPTTTEAASV